MLWKAELERSCSPDWKVISGRDGSGKLWCLQANKIFPISNLDRGKYATLEREKIPLSARHFAFFPKWPPSVRCHVGLSFLSVLKVDVSFNIKPVFVSVPKPAFRDISRLLFLLSFCRFFVWGLKNLWESAKNGGCCQKAARFLKNVTMIALFLPFLSRKKSFCTFKHFLSGITFLSRVCEVWYFKEARGRNSNVTLRI